MSRQQDAQRSSDLLERLTQLELQHFFTIFDKHKLRASQIDVKTLTKSQLKELGLALGDQLEIHAAITAHDKSQLDNAV